MKSRDTVPTRETMSKICHFYPPVLVGLGNCKKKKIFSPPGPAGLVLYSLPSSDQPRSPQKRKINIYIIFVGF